MTQPPDRPPYGADPYGADPYGADPYRDRGAEQSGGYRDAERSGGYRDPYGYDPPYRQEPTPGYGQPSPGYGQPAAGYDPPADTPPYASRPDPPRPGYTSSQPGYPPRHGYPPQPGYPPQSGYPSEPDHPSRPGYPPHAGYAAESGYAARAGAPPSRDPDYGAPAEPGYPGAVTPPRKRGGAGVALGIIGGVAVLMLLLGVAAYLFLGQRSDTPGSAASPSVDPVFSNPAKVVDRWLNAMFILKDAKEMIRYTCKREADQTEVEDAIKRVKKAEKDAKDASLTMKVSWSTPTEESKDESSAKVKSTLKVTVGDKTEEKPAHFDLVYEAGWKVCDTEMK